MGDLGSAPVRVIIADPEAASGDALRSHLLNVGKGRSFDFRFVRTASELRRAHQSAPAALVVADEAIPREDPEALSSLAGATVWVAIGDFAAAREAGWSAGAACVLVKPVSAEQVSEALEEVCEAPPPRVTSSSGEADVLVVDDEADVAEQFALLLHEAGYTVQACVGGREAVSRLLKDTYRMAIVDLVMPDPDGFDLIRVLRSDPRHRSIPILVVSGSADMGLVVRAVRAGAGDILIKPVDPKKLVEKVKRLVGSGSRA